MKLVLKEVFLPRRCLDSISKPYYKHKRRLLWDPGNEVAIDRFEKKKKKSKTFLCMEPKRCDLIKDKEKQKTSPSFRSVHYPHLQIFADGYFILEYDYITWKPRIGTSHSAQVSAVSTHYHAIQCLDGLGVLLLPVTFPGVFHPFCWSSLTLTSSPAGCRSGSGFTPSLI